MADPQQQPPEQPQRTDPYIAMLLAIILIVAAGLTAFGDEMRLGRYFIAIGPISAILISRLAAKSEADKRNANAQQQVAAIPDAVAAKISPKDLGIELLKDESFIVAFAEKLAPHLKLEDVAEAAATKALQKQRAEDQKVRVGT